MLLFLLFINLFFIRFSMAYTVHYLTASQVENNIEEYSDCGIKVSTTSSIDSLLKTVWVTSPREDTFDILIPYTFEEGLEYSGSAGGRLFQNVTPSDTVTALLKDETTPYEFNVLCKNPSENTELVNVIFTRDFADGYLSIPFEQIEGDDENYYSLELLLRNNMLELFDLNNVEKPQEQPVLARYNPTSKVLDIPKVTVEGKSYYVRLKGESDGVLSIESITHLKDDGCDSDCQIGDTGPGGGIALIFEMLAALNSSNWHP